ncbi:MAG: NrfD/PsrC family molybdoenzyme membrane anchor subunit [Betaproteobacteria bacterium]
MIDAPSSTWFTAAPHWQWLIATYFFFGGLAGGCYLIAAIIDLFGRPEDRPLARLGYYVVLPCLLVSGILLILDLSRPDRFWHLLIERHTFLPMFKYWSPMSVGTWALLGFGFFALLSFIGALAESGRLTWRAAHRLRPPGLLGAVIAAIGALLGLYVAGYTGVLLAVTNRPIWSDTPLLGALLVVSGVSISAAFMMLVGSRLWGRLPGVLALDRLDARVIVLELVVLIGVIVSLGAAARGWLNAWGLLLLVGVIGIGMAAPLLLNRRRDWLGANTMAASAVLVLIGGAILRIVIVFSAEAI